MALTTPQTNYYVDYSGGNDTTGDGSVGSPWKTIQKALDTITRDTTNGDRINIFNNAAHVLGAALNPTTYGADTGAAPLTIAGYNSSTGLPAEAEINCNGFNLWDSAAVTSFQLVLSHIYAHSGTDDASTFIDLLTTSGGRLYVFQCRFVAPSSGSKVLLRNRGEWILCASTIKDFNTLHTGVGSNWNIWACWLDGVIATSDTTNSQVTFANNLITPRAGLYYRLRGSASAQVIANNNTFYNKYGGTGTTGLQVYVTANPYILMNNVFSGFSSAGGAGIEMVTSTLPIYVVAANYFYDCTATYTGSSGGAYNGIAYDDKADQVLLASPFVDAANGNFALSAAAQDLGVPATYPGLATTTTGIDIGSVPYASGGGRRPRMRIHGV